MRSRLFPLAALIVLTPSFLVAQSNSEIIFKKANENALRNSSSTLAANEFENMQRERISQFNDIKVSGLKKIDNGDIPLSNQYGIEAKIFYDSARALIYEMKLPFQYTDLSASLKNDIAVQIKINGFNYKNIQGNYSGNTRSGSWRGGRGMGHRGAEAGEVGFQGGGNRHSDSEGDHSSGSAVRGSTDFWVKAPLAQ